MICGSLLSRTETEGHSPLIDIGNGGSMCDTSHHRTKPVIGRGDGTTDLWLALEHHAV